MGNILERLDAAVVEYGERQEREPLGIRADAESIAALRSLAPRQVIEFFGVARGKLLLFRGLPLYEDAAPDVRLILPSRDGEPVEVAI